MNPKGVAALTAALEELRQRRAEIKALQSARNEPVAVIGMACRFPGGSDTPQAFWKLLDEGRDGITEVPRERWEIDRYYDPDPAAPGKMATRFGAFIRGVDDFDASFFNISPREAAFLDPQQRLLLEVSWEALENANLAPSRLQQSATGVYVGITCFDHAVQLTALHPLSSSYAGTGSALNMAAGRLSFALGLTGPSMAIDTACSSSLVCLHLACESLRSDESRMALVGGVNLMLSPEVMVSFSQARMLAPDGRCKTFDDFADGYVRGEGCGVVVLKRLADALAEGDRILGVIRGTAVNNGGAGSGLTVPSRTSQERVMQRALEQAGVAPAEVAYVEAHGTGTSLGDPIEIEALASVFGPGRDPARPLMTGSVKTNIGHLESGAGLAGLIKILLAFEHGRIPPHLNFSVPNKHTPWHEIPVRVTDRPVPWPAGSARRIAGLSAFGFSGTNAHAVVEEPPVPAAKSGRSCTLLAISAKSADALTALSRRYAECLSIAPNEEVPRICHAAAAGRSHFAFRMARVLEPDRTFSANSAGGAAVRTAFVFNGEGGRFALALYESEPLFRQSFDRCAGNDQFALEFAWAELWKSWGLRPYAYLGTGVGDYVAACQAEVMRVEDALRLLAVRSDPPGFRRVLEGIPLSAPSVELLSGRDASDPAYWIDQLTAPVGRELISRKLQSLAIDVIVPSPRSGKALDRSVAWLYVKGVNFDWASFFGEAVQPSVTLPNYPFERQKYRLPGLPEPAVPSGSAAYDWYYGVEWEAQPTMNKSSRKAEDFTWLILADDTNAGGQLASLLRARGCQVSNDPEAAQMATRDLRIVVFGGLCGPLLDLLQSLVIGASGRSSKVWLVTRDAVDAGEGAPVSGLAQSSLWGLTRGAALEHPELFGGLVDLEGKNSHGGSQEEAERLLAEILSGSAEEQVAFRGSVRYVPRLAVLRNAETSPLPVDPAARYMITGGLGALGLRTARWLLDRGARHLILAGRRAAAGAAMEELQGRGAEMRYEQIDIADEAVVERLFQSLSEDAVPLKGIIHAAGVPGYRPFDRIDRAELENVLRPKVTGAWLLHRHSQRCPLDFFILYSSVASAWGSREQAHYSAANRYLDMLAHHRRHLGLPALSINWGPWAGGGMTSPEAEVLLRRIGVKTLDPARALETLNHLPSAAQFAVADIDWGMFHGSYEARGKRPFLDRIRPVVPETKRETAMTARFHDAPPQERRRLLAETIEREVAHVLGFGSAHLDRNRGFLDMGMDSLMSLEFRSRLETALGTALPTTMLFDFPSINALAEALAARSGSPERVVQEQSPDLVGLRDRIESLSEEEAEALLLEKLEALT